MNSKEVIIRCIHGFGYDKNKGNDCPNCHDLERERRIKNLESEIAGLRKENDGLKEQISYYESNRNTLYDKIVEHNNQLKSEILTLKSHIEKLMPWFEERMHPKTGWLKPIHITDIRKLLKQG